jgi:pentatricopeptide repeat protein
MANAQPLRNARKKIVHSYSPGLRLSPANDKMQRNANGSSPEMVKNLCKQGRLKEALHILHSMEQRVGSYTYICLLQGCIENKALEEGRLVHTHMKEKRFQVSNTYLWNTLLNMYAKCRSLADVRRVFDEMPERDVFSWTLIIQACASRGLDEEAMLMFRQMQQIHIKPNHFTLSSILPVCGRLAALEQGMGIHEELIRGGFPFNLFVRNALIDMYGKCGKVEDACEVFDKMPHRDVVSWNAMLAGYGQNGCLDEASKLFEKMPERNIVSWNTMISGYVQNGYFDNALKQFRKMPGLGVRPDLKTFTSVLPACASLGALEQGMEIHEEIVKSGFQSDVFVESALVDMYAKCGSIEKARNLFDKMSERNVVSWTAMIAGYSAHGCVEEALELFEQMQRSGLIPNHVTLVSVLSACCHAGLVDKGCKYFDLMRGHYGIIPTMEHYGCMVDLLARAGHLE